MVVYGKSSKIAIFLYKTSQTPYPTKTSNKYKEFLFWLGLFRIKNIAKKPMINAIILSGGTISPNSQKLHNIGMISEIRCAISVFMIPEFWIDLGTNKKTVGINKTNGTAVDIKPECVKTAVVIVGRKNMYDNTKATK